MAQEGLLLIKASAGSGKTYTLTKLFIEHLLMKRNETGKLTLRNDNEYFRHMLAITFTNKATDEMKHRIVTELHQLATDVKESDYCKYFREQCEPKAFEGLQQAARKALNSILFNYSAFNVSTIDSFFQSILRNFAHELDRDYNYEVQIDSDYATSAAVHSFMLALGNDTRRVQASGRHTRTTVEKWVKDFIRNNLSEERSWNFYNSSIFKKFAKNLNTEMFRSHIDQIREYLTSTGSDKVVVNDLSKIERFRAMLVKARDYYSTTPNCEQFAQSTGLDISKLKGNSALKNLLTKGWPKVGPNPKMRALDYENLLNMFLKGNTLDTVVADAVIAKVQESVKNYDYADLLNRIINELSKLGLLGIIDRKLEEYRRDNNCILIADTNELIGRIVKYSEKNRTVPFIYERVGTRINHYMIDEFQDTSQQQYFNFLPLLYESLDKDEENFNMVIGDSKQSIYRFRNADPSLFRERINSDFSKQGFRNEQLDTNYRSCPNIIKFNNEFCEKILDIFAPLDTNNLPANLIAQRVRKTYDPSNTKEYKQLQHKKEPQGMVKVITHATADQPITKNEQVLDMLPEYLLDLHKRFRWKDIGILINTHAEGHDLIARLLTYNQLAEIEGRETIAVVSEESMLIKHSPSVRRIISILRFIDLTQYHLAEDEEPDDDDTINNVTEDLLSRINRKRISYQRLYRVLGDFMEKTKNEELTPEQFGDELDKCFQKQQHLGGIDVKAMMEEYAVELNKLLPDPRSHVLTLTSMVEHIISLFLGDNNASQKETAFLLAFQDCVYDFALKNSGGTVREFLRYWDIKNPKNAEDAKKSKLSVPASASDDSIKVMTIHTAKGLEFDCVIIPFIDWSMTKGASLWWMSRKTWKKESIGTDLFSAVPSINYDPDIVPPLIPIPDTAGKKLGLHLPAIKRFVDGQLADELIDNLNKVYVAFTRPCEELHLFCITSEKNEDKKGNVPKTPLSEMHIGDLLPEIVPTISDFAQTQPGIFQCGEPRSKMKDDENKNIIVNMPPYHVTPAPEKIKVKLQHPKSEAQMRGQSLHQLLEHLHNRNDIDKVMNLGIRRGVVRDSGQGWDMKAVRALLNDLCFNPETTAWFDPENKVYNERTIITHEEGKQFNYRPDHVVKTPEGHVIIIDYKCARPQPEHEQQVRNYMRLMAEMGETDIKGFIAYLKPNAKPRIVNVT